MERFGIVADVDNDGVITNEEVSEWSGGGLRKTSIRTESHY